MRGDSVGLRRVVNTRRVQAVSMAISALFLSVFIPGNSLIGGPKFLSVALLGVLYGSVCAALLSTFVRYRSGHESSLAPWRRTAFITGVRVLLALCVIPLATWPIALSGIALHMRVPVLCFLGVNAAAVILVWFGRGWSRLGLTVVAYWVCFLWMFPLALRE